MLRSDDVCPFDITFRCFVLTVAGWYISESSDGQIITKPPIGLVVYRDLAM